MKIKNIHIKNIASFRDFSSESDFDKSTLFFGTNGSGKSTIASLLQLIDRYLSNNNSNEYLSDLFEYISGRISKEASNEANKIIVEFTNTNTEVTYNKDIDKVEIHNTQWYPVKVFNDLYTERTVGKTVDIDLKDSGLIIGEPNRLLDSEQKKLTGLLKRLENYETKLIDIVNSAINEYSALANSQANVSDTISVDRLTRDNCEFTENDTVIEERKKLGYETPEDNLNIISYKNLNEIIHKDVYIGAFSEKIIKPELDEEKSELLLNFTRFYKEGVDAFYSQKNDRCPFCFQDWPGSENSVKRYKSFLDSTFNQKRDFISSLAEKIKDLEQEIQRLNERIEIIKPIVIEEGKKYDIDTDQFLEIEGIQHLVEILNRKITLKLSDMNASIEISNDLSLLFTNVESNIFQRNKIIQDIKESIKNIRSKRIAVNKRIAMFIMHKIWDENSQLRIDYNTTKEEIEKTKNKIIELEKVEVKQDTICTVFNGLIDFLGLSEYKIASDKKLLLKLNIDYDISDECGRISSAQKKLLSICYFIAEIISEIEKPQDLRNYILIFDDPVDSADFIYFHSITALLESLELILKKILNKNNLKIGQIIVMTHNSLLYDRLYKSFNFKRSIAKIENRSVLLPSEKTMNNYKIYLQYIIRYYKNPKHNRKDMIFIGTLIRRVLEILSNFNNLDNNDFNKYVADLGKPKLALLANHLSHESFTKVLNPFSSEKELKNACEELLEVIKHCHPVQYDYIQEEML